MRHDDTLVQWNYVVDVRGSSRCYVFLAFASCHSPRWELRSRRRRRGSERAWNPIPGWIFGLAGGWRILAGFWDLCFLCMRRLRISRMFGRVRGFR